MPKETVAGCELPWGEDYPARSVVQVLWSRDEHVQVVSRCIHQLDGSDIGPPVYENGRAVQPLMDAEQIPFTNGMYVNLDRRGINELIRTLRRARDQAYGRDE